MHKKELRLHYKSLRAALSEQEIEEKSMAIANQLLRLNCWDKTYYHLFLTIEELKEVDTEFILQILAGKDKEIVIAKSDFETRKMTHFLLTDNTKIKKNEYNIPEPMNGLEVPVSMIEVVFVPLLAFNLQGHRVGYGKGFYDQFLAECNPETIKIGLSFFEAEEKIEDVFESDIPLNYCVTPSKIYQFN
ncbi:5-formyltetrahydrofolate cyclo-ligase [Flavobacterium azooxidireducens]|uniref:5-formyltetrahydrofolate cyclo-ligase n=1 Tax=Flavobacterium azooxidireducens TaxID=1871076 RepID=A0ABY4KJR0_9FLAO|nr:5-formyltetrahydrofolate cyclo-ligase [Flavobacterium azooxidireducens]UPQ80610.1 5-formyltetrahydrofolate cyclo-ligase [Flavobacterium azooxidireducens]